MYARPRAACGATRRRSRRALRSGPGLDSALERGEELRRERAVERAVVPGEAEDRHRADGYRIVDDDRPLDDRLEVEDGDLRLVDDRGGHDRPVLARVGDGERPAAHVVRAQLAPTRAAREIPDA